MILKSLSRGVDRLDGLTFRLSHWGQRIGSAVQRAIPKNYQPDATPSTGLNVSVQADQGPGHKYHGARSELTGVAVAAF
jgi:hypothetical protein